MKAKSDKQKKRTEIITKIEEKLSKGWLKEDALDEFTLEEKNIIGAYFTQKLNELKGFDFDEFYERIEAVIPKDTKNQIWQRTHNQVINDSLQNKYILQWDKDETQDAKTNMDEIMFAYISKIIDKEMEIEEVCDTLVTGKNEMPLWIKLSFEKDDKVFELTISKRFRKKKVIQDWHKTNDFYPVIIKES